MCVHLSEASVEALALEGAQTQELLVPRGVVDIKGKGPMRRVPAEAPLCSSLLRCDSQRNSITCNAVVENHSAWGQRTARLARRTYWAKMGRWDAAPRLQ